MKISKLITDLQRELKKHGDISLFYETGDGRSTWLADVKGLSVKRGYTPWKNHSQRKDILVVEALY